MECTCRFGSGRVASSASNNFNGSHYVGSCAARSFGGWWPKRREARAAKDFARSDAIRDELAAAGVEVMDGDSLGWDWKLAL